MFERLAYVYGDCPIYSDSMLPYVSPYDKKEDCCTPAIAKKIVYGNRAAEYQKGDKVSIKYLKAKMTLHLPLSAGEIARLMQAQINANGYAGRKGFNVLPGVYEKIKKFAISVQQF